MKRKKRNKCGILIFGRWILFPSLVHVSRIYINPKNMKSFSFNTPSLNYMRRYDINLFKHFKWREKEKEKNSFENNKLHIPTKEEEEENRIGTMRTKLAKNGMKIFWHTENFTDRKMRQYLHVYLHLKRWFVWMPIREYFLCHVKLLNHSEIYTDSLNPLSTSLRCRCCRRPMMIDKCKNVWECIVHICAWALIL